MGTGEDGESGSRKAVAWDTDATPSGKASRFANAKKYFGHVGLFIGLIVYTGLGAWAFMALESGEETKQKKLTFDELHHARTEFKTAIISGVNGLDRTLEGYLRNYENVIDDLFNNDLMLFLNATNVEEIQTLRWNYHQSAFFASTVLTTIGYGNMAPQTVEGRVFCIFFALIGIPLTLTVIADLGKMMAALLSYSYKKIKTHFPRKSVFSKISKKYGKCVTVGGTIVIMLLYIVLGGALFVSLENWEFFEALYFSFITITTIGFGDLVPNGEHRITIVVVILYIMIGLAVMSTAIELVRIQYADSWKKMRELSMRLQGLSGPLADTLRKYGDNINLDVNVLQDLRVLKKALASMNSGKTKREGSIWKKFWENQDGFDMDVVESDEPRLIQITIYESTV